MSIVQKPNISIGCMPGILYNFFSDLFSPPAEALGYGARLIRDVYNNINIAPFAERVALWENLRNSLNDRITACRLKAIGPSQENWKQKVIEFSRNVRPISEIEDNGLPSPASPKQAKEYNPSIAKGETDRVFDQLISNFSTWAIIGLIHNSYLLGGPGKGVDFVDVAGMIGETQDGKAALDLYIDLCVEKKGWTGINKIIRTKWIELSYWFFSGNIPGIIEKAFKGILEEIRKSTDGSGKIETIFEHLIGKLEGFLKEYNKTETSSRRIQTSTADCIPLEELSLKALCKGISPYLISEFIPKLTLCEDRFKTVPILRYFKFIWKFIIDPIIDSVFRLGIGNALPDLLQTGAEGLENAITGQADGNETSDKPVINYALANPILKFINEKLAEFIVILHEPKFETDEPVPEALKGKLEGTIKELMNLAKGKLSGSKTEEGLRDGLIGGGYQLMQFWQREQEVLLKSVLELTISSLFSKPGNATSKVEEERKYKELVEEQQSIIIQISNRIIDVEVKKMAVGPPATQINHHWNTEHRKIKGYLEEGLSNVIGLQSALKRAAEALNNARGSQYNKFDIVLNKHQAFWKGFLELMGDATKAHYPEQSKEMLMKEFYPLCETAKEQMELIAHLQDERVLGTKHNRLANLFKREHNHVGNIKQDGTLAECDLIRMQELLNEIAVLFPSGSACPREVLVLKAWVGKINELQKAEKAIETLESELKGSQDKNLERKRCKLKSEKLMLLRTIDPSGSLDRVASDAFPKFLNEFRIWLQTKKEGYEKRKTNNLDNMLQGIQKLTDQNARLLVEVQNKKPIKLHNMLEEKVDAVAAWFESKPVTSSNDIIGAVTGRIGTAVFNQLTGIIDKKFKAILKDDFNALLAGIRPLIVAEKGAPVEGNAEKKNLYIWIERLTLQETLRYYRTRPVEE